MANVKKTTQSKRQAVKERAVAAKSRAGNVSKKHAGGFVTFIREQGVVGLAVGLAIGTAAGASVKVIVDNLISPLVALLTQGVNLDALKWTVKVGNSQVSFGWGAIVSSLITLIATAFVIYLAIHLAKLDRADKSKD